MNWRHRKKPTEDPSYPRPQGVAILRRTGERIPVELTWAGIDDEGCGQWLIATAVDLARGDQIHVDVMPPRTGISWPTGGLD